MSTNSNNNVFENSLITPSDNNIENSSLKLWIGNIDNRLTEFSLLKLIQQCDVKLKQFDYVYHKTGPEKGKPKGYCFLTLQSIEDSNKVIQLLDGRRLANTDGKKLRVQLVTSSFNNSNYCSKKINNISKKYKKNYVKNNLVNKTNPNKSIYSDLTRKPNNKQSTIKEIERKLKSMEENKDVFSFF